MLHCQVIFDHNILVIRLPAAQKDVGLDLIQVLMQPYQSRMQATIQTAVLPAHVCGGCLANTQHLLLSHQRNL